MTKGGDEVKDRTSGADAEAVFVTVYVVSLCCRASRAPHGSIPGAWMPSFMSGTQCAAISLRFRCARSFTMRGSVLTLASQRTWRPVSGKPQPTVCRYVASSTIYQDRVQNQMCMCGRGCCLSSSIAACRVVRRCLLQLDG
jgi:hypothetical protein